MKSIKRYFLTIILLMVVLIVTAQSNYSPCYTNNMSKGNNAFSHGRYSEAKTYYAYAKQCADGSPSAAQQEIIVCDAKVNPTPLPKPKPDASSPTSKSSQEFTVSGVTFKMIYVEGGTFTMGCTPEQGNHCSSNERPSHSVTLSDFYIGETEVTQALWKAVMGSNPSNNKGDNLPVDDVSWNDCQEFIRKLNQLTGKNFRLPTEAQWEFAARGGNKSQHYQSAGSNIWTKVAWYDMEEDPTSQPVKGLQANELGLYDMSGNVSEWCSDWYGSYSSSSQTNPTGPSSGSYRVLRGGSWGMDGDFCRVSAREYSTPDTRLDDHGFRLSLVQQ